MAAISKAAFDALVNTILTTQITPDSVTPTTLDDLFYAIAESYFNKVDGITVDGMTNLLPGVSNGQQLNAILSLIMSQTTNQSNTEGMTPNLFRAEKTVDQILDPGILVAGVGIPIAFEDDVTTPNFDTSNLFYRDKFVSNLVMTKSFATEKVCLILGTNYASTWRVRILKNGTEIATTPTISNTTKDDYGNTVTSANGFVFPSVVYPNAALAAGDIVTTELFCVTLASSTTYTLSSANTCGKPSFSNA